MPNGIRFSRRRYSALAAFFILIANSSPALAQFNLLYQKDGAAAGDAFGLSINGLSDINGDGRADFIVGAFAQFTGRPGSAYVYSGLDGSILFSKTGSQNNDNFGISVADAGDVNGDGVPDFIVGARRASPGGLTEAGSAFVYSGSDGSLIAQKDGSASGDFFSHSVAGAGDVNGDGFADYIVGAIFADPGGNTDAGSAYVYSGKDGSLLFQKDGSAGSYRFSNWVAGVGDVNGDGKSDFLVGDPYADPGGRTDAGSIYVYSGLDGSIIYQKDGISSGDNFGNIAAAVSDINGDGRPDFMVGAPFATPSGSDVGSAYVYSGSNGALIFRKDGVASGDLFGNALGGGKDVDGDGRADFIIGAPNRDPGGRTDAGSIYTYSGATGALLFQKNGQTAGDHFGYSVALTGDLNQDGKSDMIIGALFADPNGITDAGSAYVYAGAENTISGTKFKDTNGNCIFDPDEIGLPGWEILLEPGSFAALTDADGNYTFGPLSPGIYVLREVAKPYWQKTCPVTDSQVVTLNAGDIITGTNFGNRPQSGVPDLNVTVAGGPARAGREKLYGINYQNKGTNSSPVATITLSIPVPLVYVASNAGGVYNTINRTVTWNVGVLVSDFAGWLNATVSIPGNLHNGTPLTTAVRIDPIPGDASPSDNQGAETEFVRNSFDPNEKLVTPVGKGVDSLIAIYDTLTYQVNFQNTGTDTAFLVVVKDTLDTNLDITTVASGASSHPYTFQIFGRELRWTFANINLPDSTTNELASHGFVTYKVRPRSTTPIGADVFNKGGIVFDLNAPVLTNRTRNRMCAARAGDMNGDSQRSPADVVLMLNCVFLASGSCDLCFADVNCTGDLTPADVVIELNGVFLATPINCGP